MMAWKEQMKELREEIDGIDAQLVPLFMKRMETAKKVAGLKCQNNLAVKDAAREQEIVDKALSGAEKGLQAETALLMRTIMALSSEYQHRLLFSSKTPLLPPAQPRATGNITCAYQGVPGAWGEQAAVQLFPNAEKVSNAYFEDVFLAVKNKAAHYGVVPIENSKTGAIGETYDLLRKYGCYIVGRTWLSIRQCLVGIPGTKTEDIREVLSHPEGLKQCRRFLQKQKWDETACRNTAIAAKRVAEQKQARVAAIASPRAAELYGLEVLNDHIMDAEDNQTSFVVIALQPEYTPDSDLISLTFSTQHRSGALCEVLLSFMAENLNLMRIESRPTTAGKYRFFVEIQGNIAEEQVSNALRQAASASDYFEVLGCYSCTE